MDIRFRLAFALHGATDTTLNALASVYSWSFTIHDTIIQTIVSVTPLNGLTGVHRSRTTTTIIVTFSEPMNKISVQTAFAVRLFSPGYKNRPVNLSWDSTGTVMIFTYKMPPSHKTWSANTTHTSAWWVQAQQTWLGTTLQPGIRGTGQLTVPYKVSVNPAAIRLSWFSSQQEQALSGLIISYLKLFGQRHLVNPESGFLNVAVLNA